MAIADRAVSTNDGTGTSLTISHVCAGASDRVLYVGITAWKSGGAVDPTGVTFNGVALTKIANFLGGSGNDNDCTLWRLIAPAATTANIVVTYAASHDITAIGISYSGVDQTTPNDTVQVNDSTVADPTHNVSSATNDLVVDFVMGWGLSAEGYTAAGGLTERLENNNTSGLNSIAVGDAPGAGTVTAAWTTVTQSDPHGQFGFNLNQATAGGVSVTPTTLALTTARFAPSVLTPSLVVPTPAALATATFAPSLPRLFTPTTAALVTARFAPTVLSPSLVTPGIATLITASFAPVVTTPVLVTPTTASLVTAAFTPTATVTLHQFVTPTTASLVLATFAPVLPKLATPSTAALVTAAFAPTVLTPQTLTPTTSSLVVATFAPAVTTTANQSVTPLTLALITATFAPTVTAGGSQTFVPTSVSFTTTRFAPTITLGGNQFTTPLTASLVLTAFASSVFTPRVVVPTTASLASTLFVPSALTPSSVTPTTAALLLVTFAPSITNPQVFTPITAILVLASFVPGVVVAGAGPVRIVLFAVLNGLGVYSAHLDGTQTLNSTLNGVGAYSEVLSNG